MITVPSRLSRAPHLETNPVILYFSDDFRKPAPFTPDIIVDIGDELSRMMDMLHCHVSQFYEWLPYNGGYTARTCWRWTSAARRLPGLSEAAYAAVCDRWRIAGEASFFALTARNTAAASNTSKRSRLRNTAPHWTGRRNRGCVRLCRRRRTALKRAWRRNGPDIARGRLIGGVARPGTRRAWSSARSSRVVARLRYSEGRGTARSSRIGGTP